MLETEIKKLTEAVNRLADLMEAEQTPPTVEKEAEQTPPTVEKEAEQTPPTVEKEAGHTTDDIKKMALAISRKDRSKQKDIKAKLAEHDAKVATDLSGDALQEVGDWLLALKDEVGA
jgi:hypothetical protein